MEKVDICCTIPHFGGQPLFWIYMELSHKLINLVDLIFIKNHKNQYDKKAVLSGKICGNRFPHREI